MLRIDLPTWSNRAGELAVRKGRAGVLLSFLATLCLGFGPAHAQTPVFQDIFENGVVTDSDYTPGFWTVTLSSSGTAVESGGKLALSASSAATGNIQSTLASPLSGDFNFFDRQLKLSAELVVAGDTAETWMPRGRLVLSSAFAPGRAAPDTLMIGFRAQNNVALSRKIDAPSTDPDANNSAVVSLLGSHAGNSTIGVTGDDIMNRFELILDASRYQLKTFNGGKGAGIIRFTGEHGISRSQWGANGDSALLLEAARMSAAGGTTATATWDNVKVETDATALRAEPFWDFQATFPSGATGTFDYRVWLPSTEPVIRGVILIGPGTGEDFRYFVHDLAAQEAARSIGFALLGYTNEGNMNLWWEYPPFIQSAVQAVLDQAAAVTGHPEIANAPLCITGVSAGAFDSALLAKYWPQRTIAYVPHRGGNVTLAPLPEAMKKVPGLFVVGSKDGNSATEPYTTGEAFRSYRGQGAQVAYAVDWGVGHTARGNQGWEGTMTWFVEVANLRYPRPTVPSTTPGVLPTLIDLDDASGWLGDTTVYTAPKTPSVTSPFTPIALYASYGGVVSEASWLPNETCARMYQALTSTDLASRTEIPMQNSVRIATPEQYLDPVPVGQPVIIEVDPREFDNTNALAQVEFFDGATPLGADTAGPVWSREFTPTTSGLHTLSIVATDAVGGKRAAFRTLVVAPDSGSVSAARNWVRY